MGWHTKVALKLAAMRLLAKSTLNKKIIEIDNKVYLPKNSRTTGTQTDLPAAKRCKPADVVDLTGDDESEQPSSDKVPEDVFLSNLMLGPHADDISMIYMECQNEHKSHSEFLAIVAEQFGY